MTDDMREAFCRFRRTNIAEMRPYIDGERLSERVSVSDADKENGSPKAGDMIARNPRNKDDQWLVSAEYFSENFEAVEQSQQAQGGHPDDRAVDLFAQAMKSKLDHARSKGRSGWDDPNQCSIESLASMLADHLHKDNYGNFLDIANFCMMLHQRGAGPSVLKDVDQSAPAAVPEWAWKPIDSVPTDVEVCLIRGNGTIYDRVVYTKHDHWFCHTAREEIYYPHCDHEPWRMLKAHGFVGWLPRQPESPESHPGVPDYLSVADQVASMRVTDDGAEGQGYNKALDDVLSLVSLLFALAPAEPEAWKCYEAESGRPAIAETRDEMERYKALGRRIVPLVAAS